MRNLLKDPNLWEGFAQETPPADWDGTTYTKEWSTEDHYLYLKYIGPATQEGDQIYLSYTREGISGQLAMMLNGSTWNSANLGPGTMSREWKVPAGTTDLILVHRTSSVGTDTNPQTSSSGSYTLTPGAGDSPVPTPPPENINLPQIDGDAVVGNTVYYVPGEWISGDVTGHDWVVGGQVVGSDGYLDILEEWDGLELYIEEHASNGSGGTNSAVSSSVIISSQPGPDPDPDPDPGPSVEGYHVYELDRGWSFDGMYIPHFLELNWYFGDDPFTDKSIQKVRIHGLAKGHAKLSLAVAGMQHEYDSDYTEPQYIDLPLNAAHINTEYFPTTNYVDSSNWGVSLQLKFEGRNTDITKPEPVHVLQVLALQGSPQDNGRRID